MISLGKPATKAIANIMHNPGGFRWWYVDLVNDRGDGVVLIWSFGLPFLPGIRDRPIPRARPAVNIAVYREGRTAFFLLQELQPEAVAEGTNRWRFGESEFAIEDARGRRRVTGRLELPVPATRGLLTGTVEVQGAAVACGAADPRADHAWTPLLTAANGSASLTWGNPTDDDEEPFSLHGRGYVDTNASTTPLHEQGIADWRWGRVGLGTDELIYYVVNPEVGAPESMVILVHSNGTTTKLNDASVTFGDAARARYGMQHHRRVRVQALGLDATIATESVVDDGPFYLRSLVSARCSVSGRVGNGVGERVVPSQVDLPWQRPLVRMRRHVVGGDNSFWLPLFSGQRRGRVGRLVSQLWGSSP
jgi:hypothetical protein